MSASIEPEGGVPGFADRERMWRELRVTREPERPALVAYADALRAVYDNGGARCGSFRLEPHPVFDWYAARGRLHELGFFGRIWGVEPVRALMPEPLLDLNFYSHDVFTQTSPFLLGGALAWALSAGGAYARHARGPVDAKRLGDAAAAELVLERYDGVRVFESAVAWSRYFKDVAWDNTWVVLDGQLVHVLCRRTRTESRSAAQPVLTARTASMRFARHTG